MSGPIDLKKLETDTFRSYQQEDGMWDVFMGLLMALWALGSLVESTFVSLLLLVPPAVFIAGRALITVPRLGRVKFGRRRIERQRALIAGVAVAVVTSALLVWVAMAGGFGGLENLGDYVFIVMTFTVFLVIAYVLEYWRLAVYGSMFAGSWLVQIQVGNDPGVVAFFVSGAIAVAVGLSSLRSFMHRYPALASEE